MSAGRFELEPLEAMACEAQHRREAKRCREIAETCTVDRERAYWLACEDAHNRLAETFYDGPPVTAATPRLDLNSAEARQNGSN
jgi:hypothetical protein